MLCLLLPSCCSVSCSNIGLLVCDKYCCYNTVVVVCRGLDLLFDGERHRIKKIVLHTNVHDHASFGVYNRCHFNLPKQQPDRQRQSGSESAKQYTEVGT